MNEKIDPEDIAELQDELGKTLVARLSGSNDKNIVEKWLAKDVGNRVAPTPDEVRKLKFALEQYRKIAKAVPYGDTAWAWAVRDKIGGSLTPVEAIRSDDFEVVITSANNIINGSRASKPA